MEFHSQAGQDQFIFRIAVEGSGKTDGTFVDIGCSHPIILSNTYALECCGWRGLLVDSSPDEGIEVRKVRKSPFILADGATLDWDKAFADHGHADAKTIDYLSFDVDGSATDVFAAMPWRRVRFGLLTVEHDSWRFGLEPRRQMREALQALGYDLLCPDVSNLGVQFEDWWVDPQGVYASVAERFRTTESTDWSEIVRR